MSIEPSPKKELSKSKDLPGSWNITITKFSGDIVNPDQPNGASLGYMDVYQLRDADGGPAGRGYDRVSHQDLITWGCDQPFTFLAADRTHWTKADGTAADWGTLLLWDGTDFDAVNSIDNSMPGSPKYSLVLKAVGPKKKDLAYTVMIPRLKFPLTPLRGVHVHVPPFNLAIVRSTVILQ